jgi:hypothetical protein
VVGRVAPQNPVAVPVDRSVEAPADLRAGRADLRAAVTAVALGLVAVAQSVADQA